MKIRWSIIGYVIKIHVVTLIAFSAVAMIFILLDYKKPTVDPTKFYLWFIAWIAVVIYIVKSKIDIEREEEYRKELEKED
ncbi:MAG: hypothetical protein KJO81_01900 [Gammaproteobacteria bacterium]|nr:hypothetical protein [Gammaproteobacteria bacterium]MBT8123559.1 hypothetical protein [Gammaproteobacteria bacterium]NNC66602.1 hypothetical protein [Gammaproteobacteria bacterium]